MDVITKSTSKNSVHSGRNNNRSQKLIQHIPTQIEETLLKAAKGKGDT
jgi:hypothetical protein